mgnify:CR=1 FL=1
MRGRRVSLTFIKILLSIPIGVALAYSFIGPAGGGILGEIQTLGTAGAMLATGVFLALVYLYAGDLKRSLKLVSPAARKANPNSVWLMFLLPYNFIEDFFIIANVGKSIEAEAHANTALSGLKTFGFASGYGWCVAQIVSLIPNDLGSVAGLIAIAFWIRHWAFIRRANRALARSQAGRSIGAREELRAS